MIIQIEDKLLKEAGITEEHLKEQLALMLYDKKLFSMAQACRLVNLKRWDFLALMEKNNISLNYDESDLNQDLKTIAKMKLDI
jgi:predicted HTH domain antitoxin